MKRIGRIRPLEAALEVPEADLVKRGGAIHVTLATRLVPERKHRRRALRLELGDTSEVVLGQARVGIHHREKRVASPSRRNEFEGNVRADLASQAHALPRRQATIGCETVDHEQAHARIAAQPSAAPELT